MRYLLDTNVLSELTREVPDNDVLGWFDRQSPIDLGTSVIVIGELRFGIERKEPGKRRTELEVWFQRNLPGLVRGGILPVDWTIVERYGRVRAEQFRQGLPRGELDT